MKATAIFTLSVFHILKLFMRPRQRPCGISDWDIPATQSLLKFCTLLVLAVINLKSIHVLHVENILACHLLLQFLKHFSLSN